MALGHLKIIIHKFKFSAAYYYRRPPYFSRYYNLKYRSWIFRSTLVYTLPFSFLAFLNHTTPHHSFLPLPHFTVTSSLAFHYPTTFYIGFHVYIYIYILSVVFDASLFLRTSKGMVTAERPPHTACLLVQSLNHVIIICLLIYHTL